MAVLSNKPDDFTRRVVGGLLGEWDFEVVLGAREGVPLKPNPASALEVAERLRVEPAEALYVGDTNTDMRTAEAAGMYAVGVEWGFRTPEELRASGARTVISDPLDLLELL
jgi:phosphoglycolate phosphatase